MWSRSIDLSQTYKPALRYYAWFQAIDFSKPDQGGQPTKGVSMIVEGSTDAGQTWTLLDTVSDTQAAWQQRDVPLDGKIDGKTLLLRFTASNPKATDAVEAGIDDVQLSTLTAACNPDAPVTPTTMTPHAGGCDMSGNGVPSAGMLLLTACALLLARRRTDR